MMNTPAGKGGFDRSAMEPTFKLSLAGRREFRRLVQAIASRGLTGRVDAGHVTMAAHLAAELERILADPVGPETLKLVSTLTAQIRGLKRELALTLQPSRSTVKGVPGSGYSSPAYDAWRLRNGG